MKVEKKRRVKALAEIRIGECFTDGEGFYIKTDETDKIDEIPDGDFIICVEIKSGTLCKLDEGYMVTPINVKAVIE